MCDVIIERVYEEENLLCVSQAANKLKKYVQCFICKILLRPKKKICGFPVSSYKNLGRVGRF